MVSSTVVKAYRYYKKFGGPSYMLMRRSLARSAAVARTNGVGTCLDIGAGIAPYKAEITKYFRVQKYIATDFAQSDAINVVADARFLPVRDQSMDLATCFGLVQGVAEFGTVLDEVKRVLRKGGHFVISFPFVQGERDVVDFHRWSIAGMSRDLADRGFTVLLARRHGGIFLAFMELLLWSVQHAVPGSRKAWRAPRTPAGYAREGLVAMLTFPLIALSWVAVAADALLPATGCYREAMICARLD